MADKYKSEMDLKDFVEAGAFEPGSRAYEKSMQDDVDQAAERYDMVKGAKKALKRIKTKEKIDQAKRLAPFAPGIFGAAGTIGNIAGMAAKATSNDMRRMGMTDDDIAQSSGSFKHGGSVMARGCKMGRNKKTKIY